MWRREKEWNEAWKTGRFSLLWTVEMYARVPRRYSRYFRVTRRYVMLLRSVRHPRRRVATYRGVQRAY